MKYIQQPYKKSNPIISEQNSKEFEIIFSLMHGPVNDINCTWSKPSLDGVGSVVVMNGELESSVLSTVKKKNPKKTQLTMGNHCNRNNENLCKTDFNFPTEIFLINLARLQCYG